MKKLTLDIDALEVESFAVKVDEEQRGTVEMHYPTATCDQSCGGTCASCVATCYNTCPNTCWQTCATCNTCQFHCTHISEC